jgi:hypothetical protein
VTNDLEGIWKESFVAESEAISAFALRNYEDAIYAKTADPPGEI